MPSDARKSLEYVEQTLGVHTVYEDLLLKRDNLDGLLSNLAEHHDSKRDYEVLISDREMELTLDEAGKHPGMSVAAMERHLKVEFHKDDLLRQYRDDLSGMISNIEGVKFDIQMIETDIRIGVARLTELGGYLNYLAVLKSQHS